MLDGKVISAALMAACAILLALGLPPARARGAWMILLLAGVGNALALGLAPQNLVNINITHYYLGAKHPFSYFDCYRLINAAVERPQVAMRDLEHPPGIVRGDPRSQRAYYIDLMRESGVAFNPLAPLEELGKRAQESGVIAAEADRILEERLPPRAVDEFRRDVRRALVQEEAERNIRGLGRDISQDYGFNGSPFYALVRQVDPSLHMAFGKATALVNLAWQVLSALALVWVVGLALGLHPEGRLAMGALLFASWDFVSWTLPGLVFAGLWLPVGVALLSMRRGRPLQAGVAVAWAGLIKIFPLVLLLPAVTRLLRGGVRHRRVAGADPSVRFSARMMASCALTVPVLMALSLLSGRSWAEFLRKILVEFQSDHFIVNSVSLSQLMIALGGYGGASPLSGILSVVAALALVALFLRDDGGGPWMEALPRRALLLLGALGWVLHTWFNYYAVAPLLLLPVFAGRHRVGAAVSAGAMALATLLPEFDDPRFTTQTVPLLHVLKLVPYLAVPGWLVAAELGRSGPWGKGWRRLGAATCAACALAVAAETWRLQEIRRLDGRAGAFLDAGVPERALAEYDALVRIHPRSGMARMNRAIALAHLGRRREAGDGFARAAELTPDSVPIRKNYARWLAGEGRLPEAAAQLEAAREIAPWDDGVLLELARVRLGQGKKDEARELLARVLELNPGNTAVLELMSHFRPGTGS